ncbi:MAG TPA: hypothetical protein VGN77_05860, partial [Steroidobacteraceae bacterium]|nr:hypothetical protein [Steroidobacteraceae bacterium]
PANRVDTLVLGCTHFPVLKSAISAAVGADVQIVDSAATTAASVRSELALRSLLRPAEQGGSDRPCLHFLATDGIERFARVGGRFLGTPLGAESVELVDF